LSTGIDLDVPFSANVLKFSFVSVIENEVRNAVMSYKSNAAEVDETPLNVIKSLLPVLLNTLTTVSYYMFICLEFPAKVNVPVVLAIPKVGQEVYWFAYLKYLRI
jgi:hypothetical protein